MSVPDHPLLGLKHGKVQLVPHRTEWAQAFLEERARLNEAVSSFGCKIEHVGSTAIPALVAKPILDIAVGVPADTISESVVSGIQALGYEYRGDFEDAGGHLLVRESEPLVRTHHLHVVALADPQWESYLLFRDHLRRNPTARRGYEVEKRAMAERHPSDREAYTAAKDRVVQSLLSEARDLAST